MRRAPGILRALADEPGWYVPSLYRWRAEPEAQEAGSWIEPVEEGLPVRIEKRLFEGFAESPGWEPCIVPFTEVVHDRLNVEVLRGCARGCRFCQAGMMYRPVRERSADNVVASTLAGLAATGYDEVSLTSLSSTDHSQIADILTRLNRACDGKGVRISVPSQRLDAFGVDMAGLVAGQKKGGLTFAPEAGTQRLRDVINKNVTEEDLFGALDAAFAAGWRRVKLYFMIGLPTETDEDIKGIASLASRAYDRAKAAVPPEQRGNVRVSVSCALFVPKAQTPFQWDGQIAPEEALRRVGILRRSVKYKAVDVHWHDPATSFVEAVMSRAGREAAAWVEAAWRRGARFDAWTECFDGEAWRAAAGEAGIDPEAIAQTGYPTDRVMPWDHISTGVSARFLRRGSAAWPTRGARRRTARSARAPHAGPALRSVPTTSWPRRARRPGDKGTVLLSPWTKGTREPSPCPHPGRRFPWLIPATSACAWNSASRGAWRCSATSRWPARSSAPCGAPACRSPSAQGFSPHMKIAFGAALPVGVGGLHEVFDLQLTRYVAPERALEALQAASAPDLMAKECRYIEPGAPAASVAYPVSTYRALLSVRARRASRCRDEHNRRAQEEGEGAAITADFLNGRHRAEQERPWPRSPSRRSPRAPCAPTCCCANLRGRVQRRGGGYARARRRGGCAERPSRGQPLRRALRAGRAPARRHPHAHRATRLTRCSTGWCKGAGRGIVPAPLPLRPYTAEAGSYGIDRCRGRLSSPAVRAVGCLQLLEPGLVSLLVAAAGYAVARRSRGVPPRLGGRVVRRRGAGRGAGILLHGPSFIGCGRRRAAGRVFPSIEYAAGRRYMPRGLIPGHEHPSGRMGCSQVLPGVDNGKKAPGEIARSLEF